MTATRRRRAHRGDGEQLREEIVGAATELLAAAGNAEAVSIRKVADAVGVTPPSIYLHFADKTALLDAVCSAVFEQLDRAILAAADGVQDPGEVLLAYGLAYVEFAVEHPEHYRLATMSLHTEGAGMTELDQVLADSAFTHLLEAVRRCQQAGMFAAGDPLPIALQLWATVHGLASLMITKPFLPWGERDELARQALGACAMGLAVFDRAGGYLPPRQAVQWLEDRVGRE